MVQSTGNHALAEEDADFFAFNRCIHYTLAHLLYARHILGKGARRKGGETQGKKKDVQQNNILEERGDYGGEGGAGQEEQALIAKSPRHDILNSIKHLLS